MDQPSNRQQQCSMATSAQRHNNGQQRGDCTLQMCTHTHRSSSGTCRGVRKWVWHFLLYLKHLHTRFWAGTLNWSLIIILPEFHWMLEKLSSNWRWFNHYWMIELNWWSYVQFLWCGVGTESQLHTCSSWIETVQPNLLLKKISEGKCGKLLAVVSWGCICGEL